MNTSDSFSLLLNQLIQDQNEIINNFALVGILYLGKKSIESLKNLGLAIKQYLVPSLVSNEKWLNSLGTWAIIFGCSNQIGYGYARELAKRKINLVLIDQNQEVLSKMLEILSSDFQIDVLIIKIDSTNFSSMAQVEKAIIGRDVGIFVNCSCLNEKFSYFHDLSKSFIENSLGLNVITFSLIIRIIIPSMFQKNKGVIVNFSTKNSLLSSPYLSIFGASNIFSEKLIESLKYEYASKKIFFQNVNTFFLNEKKIHFENDIQLSKNVAHYTSSAIRTLGWSSYSFGYWLNAFKAHLLFRNFPLALINFVYSKILKKKFKKSIEDIGKKKQ